MEAKLKGRALRLEVSEADRRVWFRLYSEDAAEIRSRFGGLNPGEIVYIRARVIEYLIKGGWGEEFEMDSFRKLEDKFSLDAGAFELLYGGSEIFSGFLAGLRQQDPTVGVLGALGIYEPLMEALNWIRRGLDSPALPLPGESPAIERFHSAEAVLSGLLGNPIWTRPE